MISDIVYTGIEIDCLSCGAVLKQMSAVEGVGYKTVNAYCLSCGDRFEIKVGRRGKLGQEAPMTLRLELEQIPRKKKARS